MKIQKFKYIKNEKSFLDEIKNIFWRAIIWWKNKNLLKIADTSFKSHLWKKPLIAKNRKFTKNELLDGYFSKFLPRF